MRDETPHLAIEYERILAGGPNPKKAHEDEVVGAQPEKPGENDIPTSSLDDRLATLIRLKEQDLITEEDYLKEKAGLA